MTVSLDAIVAALETAGLLVDSQGALPTAVSMVTDDSRRIEKGALFVAVRGSDRDGHQYLSAAAEKGAAAVIVEIPAGTTLPALVVNASRRAAGVAGAVAAGWPARDMQLAAVTGTNGKTTTVGILRHLLDDP